MNAPRHWRLFSTALLLAVTVALAGCGRQEAPNVVHVNGTVTYDGKPLPLGMIVFEPDPSRGNRGPQGHADIKEGKFDTRRSRQGAVVGPQLVRITGGDGVNPEPFTPFGNLLFEEHSVRVELSREQAPLQLDVPRARAKK